jgi:hypothetical protein
MKKINYKYWSLLLVLFTLYACSSDDGVDDFVEQETPDEIIEEQPEETPDETTPEVAIKNINWENWYLSVPVDRGNGSATSIFYETIVNDNLTAEQSEYFSKNEDGSYNMYTKYTGFTTSGGPFALDDGKYCRTELREFWKGNQTTSDNWSMSTGLHILESTVQVEYCGGTGQTYVAQIHGIETDGLNGAPATVKVQWKNGYVVIEYYVKPDADKDWTSDFDEKITIGNVGNEIFTIKIKIENGKLYYALVCEAKNINTNYTFVYDYVGNGYLHDNYFKTGNYFKWNKDYEESAKVILHKVVTLHQ